MRHDTIGQNEHFSLNVNASVFCPGSNYQHALIVIDGESKVDDVVDNREGVALARTKVDDVVDNREGVALVRTNAESKADDDIDKCETFLKAMLGVGGTAFQEEDDGGNGKDEQGGDDEDTQEGDSEDEQEEGWKITFGSFSEEEELEEAVGSDVGSLTAVLAASSGLGGHKAKSAGAQSESIAGVQVEIIRPQSPPPHPHQVNIWL